MKGTESETEAVKVTVLWKKQSAKQNINVIQNYRQILLPSM